MNGMIEDIFNYQLVLNSLTIQSPNSEILQQLNSIFVESVFEESLFESL